MDEKGLGKRINMARKERGYTADRLSELCSINATYLRQIEGGTKVPSLPVFINICNALKIYLIVSFQGILLVKSSGMLYGLAFCGIWV